jgi:hypothetical protein
MVRRGQYRALFEVLEAHVRRPGDRRARVPLEKAEERVEPSDLAKASSIRKEGLAGTPGVGDDGFLKSLKEAGAVLPLASIVTPRAVPLRGIHQHKARLDANAAQTEWFSHS